ncbi:putative glycolipid-binding domain-containing protein [Deinococcus budaensis]|uniref:Uncharacterized protein n=1 Tax=Deinococcus budaensis TaxID=1665626 RepID=A0A7W8GDT7_9DEIO|nr:putative glycolipid-binding domain-containing protein [Deinococcus budaensis]MBB5233498.1 hypothetical protein [Deinococcus budaensis]
MHLVWRGLNPQRPSLEHLRLMPWASAKAAVIGLAEGQPYTLQYELEVDRAGFPLDLRCDLTDGRHLGLARTKHGEWTDAEGRLLPDLHGCTDIDLRATPFTNTLSLRRLGLRVGENRELLAVWIDVPSLVLRPTRQRYTRTGEDTYHYENLETGYGNDLAVDAEGLVILYPQAFKRLP